MRFLLPCLLTLQAVFVVSAKAAEPVKSPIEPMESLRFMQVDDGLVVELVAAEPDVIDPVAAAFDDQGRLWVVEYSDYPNGPAEGEAPRSRIRILTPKKDGSGQFGDAKLFARDLLFANGLMHWWGGVIVTTDGSVQYLKDNDGDDVADTREVWFSGFVKGNPQLRCNHPTLGLNNKIYVANGLRGGSIVANPEKWGVERPPVSISGMDFCFDPFTGECEAVSGLGQFGLAIDDFGNRFVCSNRNPCRHIVVEDRDIRRNSRLVVTSVMEEVCAPAEKSHIYAVSRPWTTSTQHAGQFTAACGLSIFRGTDLPKSYYGNVFVCEPTANVLHREAIAPVGATFISTQPDSQREFLASRDEWFRPVYTFSGPDGALYVCDMYRAVIEHPEYMPDELKTRPDLTLGNNRGRIYRVRTGGQASRPSETLLPSDASTENLIEALAHPNGWHRESAYRRLFESGSPVLPNGRLPEFTAGPHAETAMVQTLALAASRGELTEAILKDLIATTYSSSPRICEAAVGHVSRLFAGHLELRDSILSIPPDQADGHLRFHCATTLGDFPLTDRTIAWLASALAAAPDDSWLTTAAMTAVPGRAIDLATAYWSLLGPDSRGTISTQARLESLFFLAGSEPGNPEQLAKLLSQLLNKEPAPPTALATAAFRGFARGLKSGGQTWNSLLSKLDDGAPHALRHYFDRILTVALDDSAEVTIRIAAIQTAALSPESSAAKLAKLLDFSSQEIQKAGVEAIGSLADPDVPKLLLTGYGRRSPAVRSVILGQLLGTEARVQALLDAAEAGELSVRELDTGRLGQLQKINSEPLKTRIAKLLAASAPEDRSVVLAQYQAALEKKGDPRRGRQIFAKSCVTCHKIGDLGVNVAPDIADSRVKTPVQLMTDILDPNRAIDNNYFSYTVVDVHGQIHTGILSAETASSITLKQPEGRMTSVLRSEIDEIRSNGVSLMPVGFEKTISIDQMADLISFVKNWRYLDGQVPEAVIR